MPRRPPHFKVFCSVKNHEKMRSVYGSNDALALWVRLGVESIERFADRTGDVFLVHDRELPALTGCGRPDVARTWLSRLADVSPICASREADVWRITFPNLAEKQFGRPRNGVETGSSSSASSTASVREEEEHPPSAGDARGETRVHPWKRLGNMLKGAEPDERDAWLEAVGPEIHDAGEAETPRAKDEPEAAHRERVNAARRTIASKRWRVYLKGPREFLGIAERQALEEATRRTREEIARQNRERGPPPDPPAMPNVRRIG